MSKTENLAELVEYHAAMRDHFAGEMTRAHSFSTGKALAAHRDKHARWRDLVERLGAGLRSKPVPKPPPPPPNETTTGPEKHPGWCNCAGLGWHRRWE